MADLPFELPAPLADRLRAAADREGKIARALEALGGLAGREVALVGIPAGAFRDAIAGAARTVTEVPDGAPVRVDRPDGSLDAVVAAWSSFRGVDPAEVAEVDRVLRPGGRLLVVHDYGRDDVVALADPSGPQYASWSRRDGPFLRGPGFRIRVLHCFWTFDALEEARAFLAEAFGAAGVAAGERLKRPRLAWNVAVYHRLRGGVDPERPDAA